MKIDKKLRFIKGVYKITNLINNKCYIGSSVDVYQRGATYRHLFKVGKLHNNHLQSSMKKYGFNNFKFELLCDCGKESTNEELHKKEQYFINLINPEYNKRSIVDKNYQISPTAETRAKISKSLKLAFSEGRKPIHRVLGHSVAVSLFDNNGKLISNFPSMTLCADYVKVSPVSVRAASLSKTKKLKNFILLKTSEIDSLPKYLNVPRRRKTYQKSVELIDLKFNKTYQFEDCKTAAAFIKCKPERIKINYMKNRIMYKRYKITKYGNT